MEELDSHKKCIERIHENWNPFLEKRRKRLLEPERHQGVAAEKVAENILEDLFTEVLDWPVGSIDHQVGHADMILVDLGIKYFVLEIKRPGSLAWNRRSVEAALEQARRYADEQKVQCVGISDGFVLYAANVVHGGLKDRVFISLDSQDPQEQLWWLSRNGIYRTRDNAVDTILCLLPENQIEEKPKGQAPNEELLHPKYKIPVQCFAYVGNASKMSSWRLPYRLADGSIDLKRLPKAIQAILSNYRGVKVSGIPETDIPEVLVRLGRAAASIGKMPFQLGETAEIYHQLCSALEQLGRLEDVKKH